MVSLPQSNMFLILLLAVVAEGRVLRPRQAHSDVPYPLRPEYHPFRPYTHISEVSTVKPPSYPSNDPTQFQHNPHNVLTEQHPPSGSPQHQGYHPFRPYTYVNEVSTLSPSSYQSSEPSQFQHNPQSVPTEQPPHLQDAAHKHQQHTEFVSYQPYNQASTVQSASYQQFHGHYKRDVLGEQHTTEPIPIVKYEVHPNTGDGNYHYSYETGNGIVVEERGSQKEVGEPPEAGTVAQGSYSYTDPNGNLIKVTYTADENGFVAQGNHLPTAPPVPPEILAALEKNAAEEAAQNEGTVSPSLSRYFRNVHTRSRHQ